MERWNEKWDNLQTSSDEDERSSADVSKNSFDRKKRDVVSRDSVKSYEPRLNSFDLMRQAIVGDAHSEAQLRTLGNKSFKDGAMAKAEGYYSQAIEKALKRREKKVSEKPKIPLVMPSNLESVNPETRAALESLEEELIEIEKSKLDPNETIQKLYNNRSIVRYKLGKFAKSVRDARAASNIQKDWVKAYWREALASSALERYDDAIKAYKKALKYDPGSIRLKKELESTIFKKFRKSTKKSKQISRQNLKVLRHNSTEKVINKKSHNKNTDETNDINEITDNTNKIRKKARDEAANVLLEAINEKASEEEADKKAAKDLEIRQSLLLQKIAREKQDSSNMKNDASISGLRKGFLNRLDSAQNDQTCEKVDTYKNSKKKMLGTKCPTKKKSENKPVKMLLHPQIPVSKNTIELLDIISALAWAPKGGTNIAGAAAALCHQVVRKEKFFLYLAYDHGNQVVKPEEYDLTAKSPRASQVLFCRVLSMYDGNAVNTAALLALHSLLYHSVEKNTKKVNMPVRLLHRGKEVVDYGLCCGYLKGIEQLVLVSSWEGIPESKWEMEKQNLEQHEWIYFRLNSGQIYFLDFSAEQFGETPLLIPHAKNVDDFVHCISSANKFAPAGAPANISVPILFCKAEAAKVRYEIERNIDKTAIAMRVRIAENASEDSLQIKVEKNMNLEEEVKLARKMSAVHIIKLFLQSFKPKLIQSFPYIHKSIN